MNKQNKNRYTLDDFNYQLPKSRIAQKPAIPRDHSKLLVYDRQTSKIYDDYFYNVGSYLHNNSTLLCNNSKVEKCRLLFDNCEIFILKRKSNSVVEALVRPGRKFKVNSVIQLNEQISCNVIKILEDGIRCIEFNIDLNDSAFDVFKHTPFPPYITQNEQLSDNYQTVYAKQCGSKAAPTAGLHFTPRLLNHLEQTHSFAEVTLHVGMGTFAPVKTAEIEDHTMHSEWFEITETTARELTNAAHITAIGTTSVRVAESVVQKEGVFNAQRGTTDIFIKPGFTFKAVDSLITNFHLPKSTLLMLVSAFMGFDEMKRVYQHAIDHEYRFYSFGDAMLIL